MVPPRVAGRRRGIGFLIGFILASVGRAVHSRHGHVLFRITPILTILLKCCEVKILPLELSVPAIRFILGLGAGLAGV
jgi:hypothetical protein